MESNDFSERLKRFVEYTGLSISVFEKETGVSHDLIRKAIKHKKSFGIETLRKITESFPQLNVDWFITGSGEMIKEAIRYNNKDQDLNSHPGAEQKLIDIDKELLEVLRENRALQKRIDQLEKKVNI